ncbi:SGNH/GDSL hydrolase family protein [Streptomyces olivaceoviridis]|uniref:hypothetical protein n=1 Tax=Streptomyces olivaceoviridis TaxID=1921 RepID=UPI0036FC8F2C
MRPGGGFDAFTALDRVLPSLYGKERILLALDGGDHLHPDDKGMQEMADAVDPTNTGVRRSSA